MINRFRYYLTLIGLLWGILLLSACAYLAESSPPAPTATPPRSALMAPIIVNTPATPSVIPEPPVYTYTVINTYPHDPAAFTQGLIFENGVLYESTGLYGRSSLRKVDLETGTVLQIHELEPQFFGEGLTAFGDTLIQLTWQSNVGFVYDKQSFNLLREFSYPTEGWGITHDGEQLIMSDGTDRLFFLDPETFQITGHIYVTDAGRSVDRLNELEYIHGKIYANIWQTDLIARIDPHTGAVEGWIDLSGLLAEEYRQQPVDVLNGIAYDAEHDRFFVTGKLWPKLFEIKLIVRE